jgi:hypothetical protein
MASRRPIAADEVDRIFNEACIRDLAQDLPPGADLAKFASSLRADVYRYLEQVPALSGDEVRAEIKKLHGAANFKRPSTNRSTGVKYEKVARLRERLSPETARLLTDRAARMSHTTARTEPPTVARARNGEFVTRKGSPPFSITLPKAGELRDPALRERACERISLLCSFGDQGDETLYAPRIISDERPGGGRPIRRRRPKRRAELEFVGDLRATWLMAGGKKASPTAIWHQPGPFVRCVAKCLTLVGAYDAPSDGEADRAAIAAEKLIHEWERRRKEVRKRMLLKLIEKRIRRDRELRLR